MALLMSKRPFCDFSFAKITMIYQLIFLFFFRFQPKLLLYIHSLYWISTKYVHERIVILTLFLSEKTVFCNFVEHLNSIRKNDKSFMDMTNFLYFCCFQTKITIVYHIISGQICNSRLIYFIDSQDYMAMKIG